MPRRTRPTAARPARPLGVWVCALAVGACAGFLAGCVKPLFPKNAPRSQFEAYDTARNQNEPAYVFDEFGRPRPNLRGRLSPKR